jgi:hypothetical protein
MGVIANVPVLARAAVNHKLLQGFSGGGHYIRCPNSPFERMFIRHIIHARHPGQAQSHDCIEEAAIRLHRNADTETAGLPPGVRSLAGE